MSESISAERPSVHTLLWRARDVLLASPAWLEYMRKVYTIDPGGHPFLTYVGLNFTAETIKNYKFYFSFFRRLSEAELATLLPVPDRGRFDEFYAQWQPTPHYDMLHRGTTFAVKLDADNTLTYYYHLRIRGLPFGPPERLELAASDRDNYHGVCEEFTGTKRHLKRYYYLNDKATIARSLQYAGLPDQSPWIDSLEYIESEGRDKMDWITGDRDLIDALIHERGPPRLISGLIKICNDCGFELYGPGSAVDLSDHAIYFVEPALTEKYRAFDGVRRFATHHLKLKNFPGDPP